MLFTDQVGNITVPIVDAAVAYECLWSQTTYILIARNIISVPSMDHNKIPPFILREAGLTVNYTDMIHLNEPSIDDHDIIYLNSDLRMRLHLHGKISCFSNRMPSPDEILDPASRVVVITPEGASWNPQCTSYQLNKETHIYYYGHLTQPHHRTPHLIKDTNIHMDSVRVITPEA